MPPETTRAPSAGKRVGHDRGVLDGPSLVGAEGLLGSELEGHGLAGDDLHQRSALRAGKDVPVDRGGQRALVRAALDGREVGGVEPWAQRPPAEDRPAAWAAQGLVGRRRDEVGVRERARMDARGDEPGDVGHVDEQHRPDVSGDRRHALEVPGPRVGRLAPATMSLGRTSRAWAAIAS